MAASGKISNTVAGPEFGTVRHGTHDIYSKGEELVFSPQDYTGRTANNTIEKFHPAFFQPEDSVLRDEHEDYKLHAEMKAWKDFRNAGNGLFSADFVTGLDTKNAFGTAELVSATSSATSSVTTVSGQYSQDFFSGFAKWFGLRVSSDTLIRAPGNRVYMPVFSKQE